MRHRWLTRPIRLTVATLWVTIRISRPTSDLDMCNERLSSLPQPAMKMMTWHTEPTVLWRPGMPRIVIQDLKNPPIHGTLPTAIQPRRSHSTQASVTMLQLILGTATHRKQGQGRRLRARQAATNMHSRRTRSHTLRDRRQDKPGRLPTPSLQSLHIEMSLGNTRTRSTLKMLKLSR